MGNIIPTRYERVRLPETSSRCVAESGTAAHNFEVASYRLLDGMGVGRYVSSSTFSGGGYDWCILFYPDGSSGKYAGYASAFLHCVGPAGADAVRTEFTLDIVENRGQAPPASKLRHTFAPASCWGPSKFIEKPRLGSLYSRLGTGYFTVRCVLRVVKEPSTECKRNLIATVPPPELPGQLERALKDGRGADVTFDVGGRVFSAHRFILAARSPVLRAELLDDPATGEVVRRLEVVDMEPSIFEMILHFVYTDSLPPSSDGGEEDYNSVAVMQSLLAAADRYKLDRLKMICEGKLCKRIDVRTVVSMLALADRHRCQRLKVACKAFLSLPDAMGAVVMTDEFKHLMGHCPGWSFRIPAHRKQNTGKNLCTSKDI